MKTSLYDLIWAHDAIFFGLVFILCGLLYATSIITQAKSNSRVTNPASMMGMLLTTMIPVLVCNTADYQDAAMWAVIHMAITFLWMLVLSIEGFIIDAEDYELLKRLKLLFPVATGVTFIQVIIA